MDTSKVCFKEDADSEISTTNQNNQLSPLDSLKCEILADSKHCSVLRQQLEQQLLALDKQKGALSNEYISMKARAQKYKAKVLSQKRDAAKLKTAYFRCLNQSHEHQILAQNLSTNEDF